MTPSMTIPDIPAFIDLEASGFGRGSYPIEVGVIDSEGCCYCNIISPLSHWTHWDNSAQQLHGISRSLLQEKGISIERIAFVMNERFAGQTLYSDAWATDNSWLGLLFDEADMYPSFKLDSVRMLLDESQAAIWHSCKQQVIDSHTFNRHRASNDARILQLTYQQVRLLSVGYEHTTQRFSHFPYAP